MGAERWIVFLVLVSLGGGIYIMSYLVDEESLERYGERVADYNAQHHETMMDAALHRAKRRPDVSDKSKVDTGSERGNETVDHPYSENDRVMRARGNDGEDPDSESVKRSNERGIKEQKPDEETVKVKRSSGQGISEEDPDHPYHETSKARSVEYLSRTDEDDPEHPYQENGPSSNVKSALLGTRMNGIFNPALTADLFESSESNDAQEEQMPVSNVEVLANYDAGMSWNNLDSNRLWKMEQSLEELHEESDDSEPKESHINPYETLYATVDSEDPDDAARSSRLLLKSDGDKKLITFNKGIDFILKLINAMFSLEGELSVPLPMLNKTFGHGIMKGTFEASQGFFKNPATLHRTGDVDIVKNGDSVALEVALGLATLEAGYNGYDLKILKIHQNGTLDVSIAENSIKMKISLTYYPNCKVDVNYLELDKLGGIKVDITGLGAFQSMFDMLSKWLLDNFTNDFRNIVNKKLIEKAKKAVAREDICKYFPLNLL